MLGLAQGAETELYARQVLDQRPVVLVGVAGAQPRKQLSIDLNARGGHKPESRPRWSGPGLATCAQSRSMALAGIIGGLLPWTALMISALSIPCR